MKYTIHFKALLVIIAGATLHILFPSTADARIDERRESIERRLFASGGIVYRDDEIESSRRRGMPYMRYLQYLPSSANIRIYFKTSDGRRPTSSELEQRRMEKTHISVVKPPSSTLVSPRPPPSDTQRRLNEPTTSFVVPNVTHGVCKK